ncbi:MAG: VWA domain-containing protein, partial [Planctomycetes bacterium]|nr:VWA domain-containing protein [Planctomycetota bacterium]
MGFQEGCIMGAGTLYFEPLVVPWVILLGALALGAAVYAYYIRWDEGAGRRRRVVLGGLRLGGFALAIFILAGAVTKREEVLSRGRPLAVLLDTSESMSERDCGDAGDKTRFWAARDALVGSAERLQEAFDLKVYTFDSAAEFLPPGNGGRRQWERLFEDIHPEGTATAIGDALSQAAPRAPGASVLVLSDGASNAGRSLAAAAEDLAARGVKVFAVPFGQSGRPNVTVKRVLGPGLLLAGEPSAFFAEVEFSGAVTGPARVALKRQGKVVATAEAQPAGTVNLVRLNFTPDEEGDLVYEVEADALPSEENTADNRLERTVHVAREKLKVLYIEENPRWEYRFLKNAILRGDRISPRLLLRFADRDIAAADYNITRLPATRQELFAFDVVVIGDVDPAFFLPRDLENLRAFVSEGGGGLLFV